MTALIHVYTIASFCRTSPTVYVIIMQEADTHEVHALLNLAGYQKTDGADEWTRRGDRAVTITSAENFAFDKGTCGIILVNTRAVVKMLGPASPPPGYDELPICRGIRHAHLSIQSVRDWLGRYPPTVHRHTGRTQPVIFVSFNGEVYESFTRRRSENTGDAGIGLAAGNEVGEESDCDSMPDLMDVSDSEDDL